MSYNDINMEIKKEEGNKTAVSFRKKLRKIIVTCLAFLISIIVVVVLAIIMFIKDPVGVMRGCCIFLKTKIIKK